MIASQSPGPHAEAALNEARQFRTLYRSFLTRVIDPDLLSVSGDASNLLAQFAALLAAYSFVLALGTTSHFAQSTSPHEKLIVSAWGTEEFLISTTITVVGLLSVFAWNSLIPDRRDSLILLLFPLPSRLIAYAKLAAVVTALIISIVAVNVFTGVSFPFVVVSTGPWIVGALRSFLAYWLTMAVSGAFIFLAIAALQNVAALLFSFSFFTRISGLLQVAVFFFILALFFLTPSLATPLALSLPANARLLAWLPSYWFLGLLHELNGGAHPVFGPLAARAVWSLLVSGIVSFSAAALAHRRVTRGAIEQPDIAPGQGTGILSRLAELCASNALSNPIDRAILLFSARTLARSRQHRLVLSVYIGLGLAMSLAFAKSLLFGTSFENWRQPDEAFLIPSLVMLFFAVVGARAAFALPFALRANWIFRSSVVCKSAAYFSATRKSLLILAATPVWCVCAALYLSVWPARPALQHLLALTLVSFLLVQFLLARFRKIPFTCSYLPGKSNLKLRLGIAGFLFLITVDIAAKLELWSIEDPVRYCILLTLLITITLWAWRRTADLAASPYNRLQFEDAAVADIQALDLRRDSSYVS